jgi:hypothetical protein
MNASYSRVLLVVLLTAAFLAPARGAAAQSIGDAQLGFRATVSSAGPSASRISLQASGGTPRWVKWGLVGAVGGAALFALLSQTADDPNPVLQDAAVGAIAGFVTIGGAVAFYDWVCKPDSRSERAGLC